MAWPRAVFAIHSWARYGSLEESRPLFLKLRHTLLSENESLAQRTKSWRSHERVKCAVPKDNWDYDEFLRTLSRSNGIFQRDWTELRRSNILESRFDFITSISGNKVHFQIEVTCFTQAHCFMAMTLRMLKTKNPSSQISKSPRTTVIRKERCYPTATVMEGQLFFKILWATTSLSSVHVHPGRIVRRSNFPVEEIKVNRRRLSSWSATMSGSQRASFSEFFPVEPD